MRVCAWFCAWSKIGETDPTTYYRYAEYYCDG